MQRVGYAACVLPAELETCLSWYAGARAESVEQVSATRDVFQARLDSFLRGLLRRGWRTEDAALLVAVLGEVGNNSFDHNLGRWIDVPGCWFGFDLSVDPPLFWVADRGVGILASLRRADPSLVTEQQAMDTAFLRVLSGRAPERRGNGLKFVRSVVNGHATRALWCRSGAAMEEFGGLLPSLQPARKALGSRHAPGVIVVIVWKSTP